MSEIIESRLSLLRQWDKALLEKKEICHGIYILKKKKIYLKKNKYDINFSSPHWPFPCHLLIQDRIYKLQLLLIDNEEWIHQIIDKLNLIDIWEELIEKKNGIFYN